MFSYMGCMALYVNGKWIVTNQKGEKCTCDSLGVAMLEARLCRALYGKLDGKKWRIL